MNFNNILGLFSLLIINQATAASVDEIIQIDRTFERQACSQMGSATIENIRGGNGQALYPSQDRACAVTLVEPTFVSVPGIFLLGVFDGHGHDGDKISSLTRFLVTDYFTTFFQNNTSKILYHDFLALGQSVQSTLEKNKSAQQSGTTACFCMLEGPIEAFTTMYILPDQAVNKQERATGLRTIPTTIYRAVFNNAGDSRALVIRNNEVVFSTVDHKPDTPSEKARIEKAGGYVFRGYACCPDGSGFALSRSWGDCAAHKDGVLSAVPEVSSFGVPTIASNSLLKIQEDSTYLRQGDILVFATDGLWDVLKNQEVADYIYEQNKADKDFQTIAQELAKKARNGDNSYRHISKDDITVLIVQL